MPPAVHNTPAPTHHTPRPRSSPSAASQFEAWLRCRKEGFPAKLVLETDGVNEEVSLWFRCTARAPTEAAPRRRRRKRPERDRRRRQRRAPPAAAMDNGPFPPTASSVESSPPAGSPPAKLPRTRAAARGGGRPDPPTPETSRAALVASPCALNISSGEELCAEREEAPDSPPPPSPHTRAMDDDGDRMAGEAPSPHTADDGGEMEAEETDESFDDDFENEEWEDGRRLNTRKPPWDEVFPANRKMCRFCRKWPPEPDSDGDGDGDCADCSKYTTFQLVKRFAPRWRYPKEY